jgi:hypothetical protein
MAFVVRRRDGRFEIRESIYTKSGPRARSLGNFAALTEQVLSKAGQRASRPFDREAVIASAIRSGSPVFDVSRAHGVSSPTSHQAADFAPAARRFAVRAGDVRRPPLVADPGTSLAQLLRFADEVRRHSPRRRSEPLVFPVLSRAKVEADTP